MTGSARFRAAAAAGAAAAALASLPAAGSAAAGCASKPGNLVSDCSFEAPPVPDGSYAELTQGQAFGGGWVVRTVPGGDGVDLTRSNFGGPGGFPVEDGLQSVDLNHDSPTGVYQDISTTPGRSYRLTFYLSGFPHTRVGCGGTDPKKVTVSAGSTALTYSFNPNQGVSPPGRQTFAAKTLDFAAGGSRTRLSFAPTNAGCTGPVIDDVTVGALSSGASASRPVRGKTVRLAAVRGVVEVRAAGATQFSPLTGAATIGVGATVDTTRGTVRLTSARTARPRGRLQTAQFRDGQFVVTQPRGAETILTLAGGSFASGTTGARALSQWPTPDPLARPARSRHRVIRRLRASGRGRFTTLGRYASATVRGTTWETVDRCDGTLVKVRRGVVLVADLERHQIRRVPARHSYLARAPASAPGC